MSRGFGIVVALSLITVGLSGCLAQAQWSGADLRVPQNRSIAPRNATWDIEVWPEADQLPVYQTKRSCCTGAEIWRAADGLGISLTPNEVDWPDYVSVGDPSAELAVGIDDGRVTARFEGAKAQEEPPDDAALIERARVVLEDAGLWPEGGELVPAEPRVSAASTMGTSDVANGTSEVTVTERRVSFTATIGDRPAVGWHRLSVDFGSGGNLREVSVLWPALEPEGTVSVAPAEEAQRLFAAGEGVIDREDFCEHYRFTTAELIYFSGAPDWDPAWAFPAYRITGHCADGDGSVSFLVSAVRGAR